MHDDPQVLLNQLFTVIPFLCSPVRLEPVFLAPDGPVALGGEGRAGPWEVSLAWTDPPHPVGSVLTFVVDAERYPETLGTEGSVVRRFEVRRWLNLELRRAEGDLLALTNPGDAWQSPGDSLREIGHGQPWRGDMRQALELARHG